MTITANILSKRLMRLAGAHRLGNITRQQLETQRTQEFNNRYESKRRIPAELEGEPFFGLNDWWIFYKSYHPNMCHTCDFFGDIHYFNGTDIRGTFPYLTIVDEDTIYPNVHLHCGCVLLRVGRGLKRFET